MTKPTILANSHLFSKFDDVKVFQTAIQQLVEFAPPGTSEHKKRQMSKELFQMLRLNRSLINKLINDTVQTKQLADDVIILRDVSEISLSQQKTADIATLATHALPRFNSNSWMAMLMAGLVLLPLISAQTATNASGYTYADGIPPGGINLCSGQGGGIYGDCFTAFITQLIGGNTTIQFSRTIQSAAVEPDGYAYIALKNCLTSEKVFGAVAQALQSVSNSASSGLRCVAQSLQWYGLQTSSTTVGLSREACDNYKEFYNAAAQFCMDNNERWKWNGIIAGSIVGGILAIAAIVIITIIVCKCCESLRCEKPSCCA